MTEEMETEHLGKWPRTLEVGSACPGENTWMQGTDTPSRGLPNKGKTGPVENFHAGFRPEEKAGIPTGIRVFFRC